MQSPTRCNVGEKTLREVGGINAEGPPVPIPNTEVKLCRADNTWLETAREDKYPPTLQGEAEMLPLRYSSVAQW